jgi:hypothetical protein
VLKAEEMNIYEIDWRISSVRRIIDALSQGITMVNHDLEMSETPTDPSYGTFDVGFALEHIEDLLGIAFVTAQSYITGTVSDIPKLTELKSRPTKRELLQSFADKLPEYGITTLELCDAIANYWKHHEEWEGWSVTDRNKRTIDTLNVVGIGEQDYFPCNSTANILWPKGASDLEELIDLLSSWRQQAIETYKPMRRK